MSVAEGIKSLQRALEFEKEGHDYYARAVERAAHPMARGIFQLLMDEERRHADHLLNLHGRLSAEGRWPKEVTISMDRDFKRIFAEESAKIDRNVHIATTEGEALRHAVDMENRGRAMYLDLAAKATTPQEKGLYASLADWEHAHATFCEDTLGFFEDKGLFMDE